MARVLEGYNVCILAYGQTGSGKTHTMFGPDEVLSDWGNPQHAALHGVAPRAIQALFDRVTVGKDSGTRVTCSYVEVYNDSVNDLLGARKGLPLREAAQGVVVDGLAVEEVSSLRQTMAAVGRGNALRVVAGMKMNARSSRGHAVLTVRLETSTNGVDSAGTLVLVDLAGMESSKKSYSVEGDSAKAARREEARHINVSLFALGSVVERLSSAGAAGHVPYRNSKLTRLLQPSLGGNCAAAFVVTLRAEQQNVDECIGTLRFAQRAKAMPVVVHANVMATPPDPVQLAAELKSASDELAEARTLIERLQRQKGEAEAGAHDPNRNPNPDPNPNPNPNPNQAGAHEHAAAALEAQAAAAAAQKAQAEAAEGHAAGAAAAGAAAAAEAGAAATAEAGAAAAAVAAAAEARQAAEREGREGLEAELAGEP